MTVSVMQFFKSALQLKPRVPCEKENGVVPVLILNPLKGQYGSTLQQKSVIEVQCLLKGE